MKKLIRQLLLILCLFLPLFAYAKITIVAAENVYGDMAQSIGGDAVNVVSIMHNPNQDPHLFSVTPATAKLFQQAQLVIMNGADYDPWAASLAKLSKAEILDVAHLNQVVAGQNPHLWYKFDYIEAFSKALASQLTKLDPTNQKNYAVNLAKFLAQLKQLKILVAQSKNKILNAPITATEPVANYLTQDLHLNMLNYGFQLSVMNDTQPSVKDRAAMQISLQQKQVKLLIVNEQVSDPLTQQLERLAKDNRIPIVAVSELLPEGQNYFSWMQQNIHHIVRALQ